MIARLFTDHPSTVNETYLEHAAFASRFAVALLAAAGAALVHALIPALFEKTAGQMVADLHHRLQTRH